MPFLLAICLIIVAFYILQLNYDLIRSYFLAIKLNGPPAFPIVGSGLMYVNKTPPEIYQISTNMLKEYGVFFKCWLGHELHIIIQDPKDLEIILSSSRYIDKSTMYNFMTPWLNEGLLLSTGKKWQDRRKIMTPAFHFKILEEFITVFDRVGNTFIERLRKRDTNEYIELYPLAGLYALDVMCETAMGVSIDALSKPDSEYVQAVKKMSHVIHIRMFHFLLRNSIFFKYSKLMKVQTDALRILHGFTDNVIKKRRQELLQSNSKSDKQHENRSGQKKRAFLDLLLHSTIDGQPLTDLDIREEVDTFMFEGHDTTSSGITFCLYNIAKHREVQEKCFKEIAKVLGTDTKQPTTISQLNQLSYLELTVKETLRIFPSVPAIARMAKENIELTNQRIIPKGSSIVIPFYAISSKPEYFDNPNEFRPERFLDERSMQKNNPFTYTPFSAGPRNCIGQKFAMYEIKSIVSKIVRNFEISLTKDSEMFPILSGALISRPENQINFYFKARV